MAQGKNGSIGGTVDGLFAMEPELRTLEGMIAILRVLGEAQDAIDPACLATLANFGGEALDSLTDSWRSAMKELRSQ